MLWTEPDYSPFLETDLSELETPERSLAQERKHPARVFEEAALDCLSESQTDLCNDLHLALVENASIRNEIAVLHDTTRDLRDKKSAVTDEQAQVHDQLRAKDDQLVQLAAQRDQYKRELDATKTQLTNAHEKLASSAQEYHQMLETAHANAIQRIAEHEERLIKESNKSIENAKRMAERKMHRQLETSLADMQSKHEEYLQKLAEEHSEEIESLQQQVAVWRHQVEVLTEAEKRNYASQINGSFSYDYQRSRFNHDSPFSVSSASGSSYSSRGGNGGTISGGNSTREDEVWNDDAKSHTYTELSSQSSPSGKTFWDKMVSLISN